MHHLTIQTGRVLSMTMAIKTKLTLAAALLALGLTGCTTANSSLAAIEPAAFNSVPADPAANLAMAENQDPALADGGPAFGMAGASDDQTLVEGGAPKASFFASLIPNPFFNELKLILYRGEKCSRAQTLASPTE